MPLAAYATLDGDMLHIRAVWGDPEGVLPLVHAQARGLAVDAAAATALGEDVARQLQAGVAAQGVAAV
jgi:hydroxymethylbilane synthase